MKILFFGDYSNLHATLAAEISRMGHDVTLVTDRGGHQCTAGDYALIRHGGTLGTVRYLFDIARTLPRLKGYDIVQLINPLPLNLRPHRNLEVIRYLARHNGPLFLTLAGDDSHIVRSSLDPSILPYSEYMVAGRPTPFAISEKGNPALWLTDEMLSHCHRVYDMMHGAVAIMYEYWRATVDYFGTRLLATSLPIRPEEHPFTPMDISDGMINLFVGQRSILIEKKGTDRLLEMARDIASSMPQCCRVINVRDLPLSQYLHELQRAHISFDQLYAMSPATNALNMMALGRVAASGAEPEYYDYIGEREMRPVIPLSPLRTDTEQLIRSLVADPARLVAMGADSRRLVEKHHDACKISRTILEFWQR